MGPAIQQCARQPFAAQHFGPLFEGQIGGDDQTAAFIRPADHVEESFGSGLGARAVTELVEEQAGKAPGFQLVPACGRRFVGLTCA